MSRTKGTFSLTSNIEPKFGAPLDARTIVKLLADLTASNTFEYPYKGMKVFVEENNKSYTLVGSDPTVSTNWIEDNSGGHTIKNPAGTAMTQRSNLQFVDLTISDDSTNDATKVESVHVIHSESELNNLPDGLYMLDEDEETVIDGNLVGYDNTTSGLNAENVQDAIDEVVETLDDKIDKEAGKGLSANDFTNEDKALIGQTLGNNTVLTTDKTPFLTRQTLNPTGFSGYVREKLIGASYAWNQLVENGDFSDGSTGWTHIYSNISSSGVMLATASGGYICKSISVIKDHVYFACAVIKLTTGTTLVKLNPTAMGDWNMFATNTTASQQLIGIKKAPNSTTTEVRIVDNRTSEWDNITISYVVFVDLTLAFGSTIADYLYSLTNNGAVTKLRDMGCPIDKYTPYGYGLYSVKTSGKKIVGKNLVEDILTGYTITANGTLYANSSYQSAVAKVIQGKTYTVKGDGSEIGFVGAFFYDKPTTSSVSYNNSRKTTSGVFSFTAPITGYVIYRTYNGFTQAQVELGSTSTTFEPYSSTTYPLGNDELRGKFDLVNGEIVASGDVKESNGEITRVRGSVHLGDVTFSYNSTYGIFSYALPNGKTWAINTMPTLLIGTGRFELVGARALASLADKQYSIVAATASVGFKDSGYTDPTLFKNSLNGVYLEYELATPTTEQSTPFADPMSLVGATTEEYIDTREIPCPVGAERQYMGQSEDVIEIPSSPLSDGVRYLKSYKSGDQEQLVWEGEGIEDVSSYFTEGICNNFEVGAVRYGRIISFNMACTPISGGDYIAVIATYVPAYVLSHIGPINVCGQSTSGLHVDAVVDRFSDTAARIKFYTNETLPTDEKIYVSGTYICDIMK